MASAGELLRGERLKRNRDLIEISAQTRINIRYLEAIEADQTHHLPGEFFYKAFLTQYASALQLDPEQTREILRSAIPVHDPDPVPALRQAWEDAQSATPRRRTPPVGITVTLLFIAVAGGSGLYAWWQQSQAQREVQAAAELVPASIPTLSAVPAQTTPEPAAPMAPPEPEPASTQAHEAEVDVAATERTWVVMSSDGKQLWAGTMQPGETRQFTIGQNARMLTGNAGTVQVRHNGEPVGKLGPRGQVREIVFTSTGHEIVSPPPKTATRKPSPRRRNR